MPRHRWHYYKEGFSPQLVEKAIDESDIGKRGIVLDPFNGGGTTTLTAALRGLRSIGLEVNPFTAFLAEAKLSTASALSLRKVAKSIIDGAERSSISPLNTFSTFSEQSGRDKWLFNSSVLDAFEGGWQAAKNVKDPQVLKLCKLALLSSAMDNCNAVRDGKCLRYRPTWKEQRFNKYSFLSTLVDSFQAIHSDIQETRDKKFGQSRIYLGDAREILNTNTDITDFNLCVTSPPYLNTFDYTDIYRPELFLGKFIKDNNELYKLRLKTVRSHVQAQWEKPTRTDFGFLFGNVIKHLNDHPEALMDKKIPMMVQAYFEDMEKMLRLLLSKAKPNAQVWLVVSNSAYADLQIPVDLILGDIGSKVGWYLKEIGVLRHIHKRPTKHSSGITELRESVVILTNNKGNRKPQLSLPY